MNLLQYYTAPKKLHISVTLLVSSQFTITSILERSIFNCPPPTIWPKYTSEVFPNSHLDNFIYNFYLCKASNTCFTCLTCSSQVPLKIRMSSKYTITKSSRKGLNTSFITRMKVSKELQIPNDITNHSNNPCLVLKEVFHASCSATLI
jgi:hypothetical protein